MSEFILYNYFRSSASQRIRIALNLKNLEYEYRAVHLIDNGGEQNSESYSDLNPSKQVPTLIHKGRALGQSMAIINYLESIVPEPPLFPADFYQKAHVIQVCEIINSGIQPLQNLSVLQELERRYKLSQEDKNHWAAHWIRKGYRALENVLTKTSGNYCFGHAVTAADLFLVPQITTGYRFGVEIEEFTTIARIVKNCNQLEAFQKAAPDVQPDTPENLRRVLP